MTAAQSSANAQQNALNQARTQNMNIRNLITRTALPVRLPIYNQTFNLAAQNGAPISIQQQIRNVGLLRGFLVEVTLNLVLTGTPTLTMTGLGPWNLLTNITFYDLSNYLRHNAPGWLFGVVNTMRQGRNVQGSIVTKSPWPYPVTINESSSQSGPAFGNNYNQISGGPATISAAGTYVVRQYYYVPIAYSDTDLRGAIYLGVVSSTANLQLTVNPNPVQASTGDLYSAVYGGSGIAVNSASTTVQIQIYQDWYDQLPVGNNGAPLLPSMDLSRNYQLQYTSFTGLVANSDFPMPYGNYRSFLSTTAILDNSGTYNSGSDVNYWAMVTANFSQMWKMDPYTQASETRKLLGTDYPPGVYYFDHRNRPLNSAQFGNIALTLNASSVPTPATAYVYLGYEFFTQAGQALGAGTLAGS
jgi:hypothetical protein